MFKELKYVVECAVLYGPREGVFEPIAAFNVDVVALKYAADCTKSNHHFNEYRVCEYRGVRGERKAVVPDLVSA